MPIYSIRPEQYTGTSYIQYGTTSTTTTGTLTIEDIARALRRLSEAFMTELNGCVWYPQEETQKVYTKNNNLQLNGRYKGHKIMTSKDMNPYIVFLVNDTFYINQHRNVSKYIFNDLLNM